MTSVEASSRPKPLIFVCFDQEHDEQLRNDFLTQLSECPVTFRVDDWSGGLTAPDSDREKALAGKIGRCDLMVVLLGAGAGESLAVRRDIRLARRANVPFFGIKPSSEDASISLPEDLPQKRVTPWDWDKIGQAISQLMREGKNHRFS